MKKLFIILLLLNFACEKNDEERFIVKLQLVPFEISGNGERLNYPFWANPVEIDEIEQTVKTVDEMYEDLEKIYGKKRFSSWGVYYWTGLTSTEIKTHSGKPTFDNFLLSKYKNEFEAEIQLTDIESKKAELVFRVDRKGDLDENGSILNGGIKYLPITIQNGKSVSVGSFYQDEGNVGVLFVLAMESMALKKNTTEKEVLEFFELGKIQHNVKSLNEWAKKCLNPGVESYSFSSNTYINDFRNQQHPGVKFTPYDIPPQPLSSISPKYPEKAQIAGVDGMVIV